MSLANRLLVAAANARAVIATAESCTGGLVAGAITEVPGSSEVFDRGFVTYSNAAKIAMLGVEETTLKLHGTVSEEVAREMAEGAREQSLATITVAVTGIAGPGGSENKPEGRVCFAVSAEGILISETQEFGTAGRHKVRTRSVERALTLLAEQLET